MDFEKIKKELNEKYPNVSILDINEVEKGKFSMAVKVGATELAYLQERPEIRFPKGGGKANADINVVRRSILDQSYLDLSEGKASGKKPHELFKRSIAYYHDEDVYGSVIRLLSNLASSGFENDIDDDKIKSFYDNWVLDIGLDELVENIFFDFFRVGFVRTYKTAGKYEPKINTLPSMPSDMLKVNKTDTAAKKKKWSKQYIPIAYTILDPLQIEITGSLFGKTSVTIKPEALKEIKLLLEKGTDTLTVEEQNILNSLPNDLKVAAKNGKEYPLDPYLVGAVDYRRMPYERYPRPRGTNAFESIDYKGELRKADYSTLDGISNYILLITVGNDTYPVTNSEVLENVAELFNTPSKSFDVVYNHTLKVEKIVSPEIGAILGKSKYEQVNSDLTGALGVARALIDGSGELSAPAASLAIKGMVAEIQYARRQVKRWLYKEYRDVAEAMGFDRFPKVRFDDNVLQDEIAMMIAINGMIDRRIMSYETGIKRLGLDWPTERKRLAEEKEKVLSGDFGIIGSPYNPKAAPPLANPDNVQTVQRTPKGTPSEGRPPGPGKKKTKTSDSASVFSEDRKIDLIVDALSDLSQDELDILLNRLNLK